jgi:uncharacterized membrane protein YcaP (DUF421 family)
MEIVVRTTLVFWLLWFLTRGSGRKELAEMSAFDLVLLVVLGDIIQQAVTQEDYSVTGAALAVCTLAGWVMLLSLVQQRLPAAKTTLSGRPVVVIWEGELDESAMDRERLDRNDLREAARGQGIDDLASVRAAVLEADGALSFVQFDPEQRPGGSQTGPSAET